MYKSFKKNEAIRGYMEALSIHTGAPTAHLEDKKVLFLLLNIK